MRPRIIGGLILQDMEDATPFRMRRQSGRADALLSLTSRWLTAFGDAG
jgi:hypothetical protein